MRVLVVKMSSMGDIIHTLPAITDAARALVDIQFDWVVEEAFAEIPIWHPHVKQVIPIALRRWRKRCWQIKYAEVKQFYQNLRSKQYDIVLDAQGSIKSAVTTRLSRGYRLGLDKNSVREKPAYLAYQQTFSVPRQQHAIIRLRQLFAKALNYPLPITAPDYGIDKNRLTLPNIALPKNYLVFVPNASWLAKRWSVHLWSLLLEKVTAQGIEVLMPWGIKQEKEYVQQIAKANPLLTILPHLILTELAAILANAKAIVSLDTGLSHLAAALATPAIVLYGPTDPALIGTIGPSQRHIKFQDLNTNSRHNEWVLNEIEGALKQILTKV